MGRFIRFFFFSRYTSITHIPSPWGYYFLIPTTPPIYLDIPLFFGWSTSAKAALCLLSHLLGAMGCMAPCGASSGDSASERKGSHLRIANRTFS